MYLLAEVFSLICGFSVEFQTDLDGESFTLWRKPRVLGRDSITVGTWLWSLAEACFDLLKEWQGSEINSLQVKVLRLKVEANYITQVRQKNRLNCDSRTPEHFSHQFMASSFASGRFGVKSWGWLVPGWTCFESNLETSFERGRKGRTLLVIWGCLPPSHRNTQTRKWRWGGVCKLWEFQSLGLNF